MVTPICCAISCLGIQTEACAFGYKWMRASLASLVCREAHGRDPNPCAGPAEALGCMGPQWGAPHLKVHNRQEPVLFPPGAVLG